jgi:hypothetical protein
VFLPVPLSFDQAVAYVLKEKGNAFAYRPIARLGKQRGGRIFFLYYQETEDPDDSDPPYRLYYLASLFRASDAEEETYFPDEIPEDAKQLKYQITSATVDDVYERDIEEALEAATNGIQ